LLPQDYYLRGVENSDHVIYLTQELISFVTDHISCFEIPQTSSLELRRYLVKENGDRVELRPSRQLSPLEWAAKIYIEISLLHEQGGLPVAFSKSKHLSLQNTASNPCLRKTELVPELVPGDSEQYFSLARIARETPHRRGMKERLRPAQLL
jgi:hypothetical protein